MRLETKEIEKIRKDFKALKSKEDLLGLLNYSNQLLYGANARTISLKALTYYANPNLCKKRYVTFTIKKKSGDDRTINAPVLGLKVILRALNLVLQAVSRPHEAATGFVPGKSIVDNAKKHVGHHYVYNIDLKDFFHSFDLNRVKLSFQGAPFYFNKEREPLAFLLASLMTHPFSVEDEEKRVLPQGSPTSPTMTNIVCRKLDRRLSGLAKRFNIVYSRYADDITFSGNHSFVNKSEFAEELHRIIAEDNLWKFNNKTVKIGPQLRVNSQKTRLQKRGYRQEVTGLVVNEKVNVTRRYVKQIRMYLYYWEKYGYEKAEQTFRKDYVMDKGHVKSATARLDNVLFGKLEYLKMVKGPEDSTYLGLKRRFDKAIGNLEEDGDVDEKLNLFITSGFDFKQL